MGPEQGPFMCGNVSGHCSIANERKKFVCVKSEYLSFMLKRKITPPIPFGIGGILMLVKPLSRSDQS